MQPTQIGGVRAESSVAPDAFECAIHSGRLADQIAASRVLHGNGDLVVAFIQLAGQSSGSSSAHLAEVGRRVAEVVHQRLEDILRRDWQIDSAADLAWENFAILMSQTSERLGLGPLQCHIDDAAALIQVTAWSSPFPELLPDSDSTCSLVEGFVATWLGAVAGGDLGALEVSCRASGATLCKIFVGADQAIERARAGLV